MNPNVVNPNQALWEKGDFTEIAAFMRQSGEAIIESMEITPPLRVLLRLARQEPYPVYRAVFTGHCFHLT